MFLFSTTILHDLLYFASRAAAAIIGGVLGAVATGILVWFLCRFAVNRQPPRIARRFLRILGGIAGAMAAVLFLPIGFGGFGLGWGGFGFGSGDSNSALQAVAPDSTPDEIPRPPPPDPAASRARIVILGGPLVRGEAFYRFDDERTPLSLAELQARLGDRMKADPPLAAIDILIYFEDSLAKQSAPVVRLTDWAAQVGLSVSVSSHPGRIPP
jgi:hypothetical protein